MLVVFKLGSFMHTPPVGFHEDGSGSPSGISALFRRRVG